MSSLALFRLLSTPDEDLMFKGDLTFVDIRGGLYFSTMCNDGYDVVSTRSGGDNALFLRRL